MSQSKMPKKYERKIVVVGKTGNGKSSLANVLIGEREFSAKRCFSAVTTKCKIARKEKSISVVDTPGLFDSDARTGLVENALEIQRAVQLCQNPHVFLVVINGSTRLTEEDLLTFDVLCMIFGDECLKKAVIVFTHTENGLDTNELKRMTGDCEEMSKLIDQCGGRFARIDNTNPRPEHKEHIIRLVDEVSKSGKACFKNDFIDVHKQVLEESLTRIDSKPMHIKIEQLLDSISKTVDEKKDRRFIEKVVGFAAGAVIVSVGVGIFAAGLPVGLQVGLPAAAVGGVASIASSTGSVAAAAVGGVASISSSTGSVAAVAGTVAKIASSTGSVAAVAGTVASIARSSVSNAAVL